MQHILRKNRGSSMLLAICIFLVFTVIGINVLATSYSNVQNTKSKYETEQTMQYMNSIYEILNKKIQDGEFVLDSYLVSSGKEQEISKTNKVKLESGRKDPVITYIEFYSTGDKGILKAKIYMSYQDKTYHVTSIYEYKGGEDSTYELKSCEGVTYGEE